jgi:hypothetical protein
MIAQRSVKMDASLGRDCMLAVLWLLRSGRVCRFGDAAAAFGDHSGPVRFGVEFAPQEDGHER